MPRFDPSYIVEHDSTRLREAQHALVNARGHYLGATVSRAAVQPAAPSTAAGKKEVIKKNRETVQRELNKLAPGLVTVNADGSLHLANPLTPINASVSKLMRDSGGWAVVDASPLPGALKTKLKNQPATFFIDLFDPLLDAIAGALVKVMENGLDRNSADFKARTTKDLGITRGGRGGFVYDLSTPPFIFTLGNPKFREINIWLYPESDALFDEQSRGILLRLRSLLAYFVLFFRKPIELQAALLRAGLDFLFPNDVVLVKTTGTEVNTSATAFVVDRIPGIPENAIARNLFRREGTFNGKVVFAVQIPATTGSGATSYYTLSPKGLLDRALEMRRQWDAKYEAYKNDKITNAAGVIFYGPRMTFLRSQGKTEAQARNIIASEDNFPAQFQKTGDRRFIVLSDRPDLGGGFDRVNGPRPSDAFIQRLRTAVAAAPVSGLGAHYVSLGADPAGGTAGTKPAVDAGTAGGGGQGVAAEVGAWVDTISKALAAIGVLLERITGLVDAVNRPAVEEERSKQAEAEAAARKAEAEAEAGAQSASSNNTLLIAGVAAAALIGLMAMRKT
jgi:hypothetical protein